MKKIGGFAVILSMLILPFDNGLAKKPLVKNSSPSNTIIVNTTTDEFGTRDNCSLREAIQAANGDSAFGGSVAGNVDDVIELPAGTYLLTLAGSGENANATGDLDIGGNISVNGAGQAITLIEGNATDRVVDIHSGNVMLNDLTITGGLLPTRADGIPDTSPGGYGGDGENGQSGGGIRNKGVLTLTWCTISNNQAGSGGNGGSGTPGADGVNPGDSGTNGGGGDWGGSGGKGGGINNLIGATVVDP